MKLDTSAWTHLRADTSARERAGAGAFMSPPKNNSRGLRHELPATITASYQLIKTADVENSAIKSLMPCQEQSSRGDVSEAVCRICLVELSEGESFRMDCCCKGDLAAAHSDCAAKWFTIRGKSSCDICGHTVKNLSPLLDSSRRSFRSLDDGPQRQQLEEDYELIRSISWIEVLAVYLSCALASLWRKLEELSEFP
ncbi:hypothetical protein SELMODRAFT_163014 [Selaginella moellendorffii]|uniref:RING-CH-type domain-containing protein n=1 Tax=Selaginella moellendorffii TaxID=88036 RepID=D8TCP5_SELML|nr:hypothetical protein SELMODRAFT_163014 [Selaginella moellendorffii]